MQSALRQANIDASKVQHVNAHATSTQVGDAAEIAAFRTVFSVPTSDSVHHVSGPAISATKSATGHLLGAAGAVEAIFTVMALRDQTAPPTLNLTEPDVLSMGLNLVQLQSRAVEMEYALSNGFGFGGVNASVIFKKWSDVTDDMT
jgi:3-oxoacyl-[acyl-carrier-protein] synthase II